MIVNNRIYFLYLFLFSFILIFPYVILTTNSIETSGLLVGDHVDLKKLKQIKRDIENSEAYINLTRPHDWNDNYPLYYETYMKHSFRDFIGNLPIFVFELTLTETWGQFGNRLGHYFEALSICKDAGLHFVAFIRSDKLQTGRFLSKFIPTVILHPNPVSSHASGIISLGNRSCHHWPWAVFDSFTFTNLDQISSIIKTLSSRLLRMYHPKYLHSKIKSSSFDLIYYHGNIYNHQNLSLISNSSVPHAMSLIPEAIIFVRCTDIVRETDSNYEYGVLHFHTYLMTIPKETSSIYILTEPLKYGKAKAFCAEFISLLVEFLRKYYSHATIAVRRGNPQDGFVQLTFSKIIICAPSSFCFWPALANTNHVYYYLSNLIAEGNYAFFRDNFHWLTYPKMYTLIMREEEAYINSLEAARKIAHMLQVVKPRSEFVGNMSFSLNNTIYEIDNWDSNVF